MMPDHVPVPPEALRLHLDTDALVANWRALDALSGAASAGAAIKADAYGLGAKRVAPLLHQAGCRDFFVAHWCEVADVLAAVPSNAVAVLHGPRNAAEAAFAKAVAVRPVINSLDQARVWHEAGGGRCDVMVDTGINRLGLRLDDLGDPLVQGLDVEVLMSHLASAEEDVALNATQRARWQAASRSLRHRRTSLANSAGIALGDGYHGDLTRPGIALYGGVPRPELAGVIRQVARPMAALLQIRRLEAGDSVGYNATFTAPAAMRAGVVALGYADGFLRSWSAGKGVMLHQGRALPVLGRVSMDMTVIDLTHAPDLQEGDWVEAAYDLPQAAERSGLSQYELLTLLGGRFAR